MNFPQQMPLRRRHQHGGVMVMALVIVMVATAGFSAWALLIAQRANNVEEAVGGTKRRLAVENNRLIARQVGYLRLFTNGYNNATSPVTVPNNWVNVSIGSWSGFPLEATTYPLGYNRFSPANDLPYGMSVSVINTFPITDSWPAQTDVGTDTTTTTLVAKSRSPLTSGDLLMVHRPTLSPSPPTAINLTGNIQVFGRVVYWVHGTPHNFAGVRATRVSTPNPAVVAATYPVAPAPGGTVPILPSNLPVPTMTCGMVGANIDVQGRLNVVDHSANAGNSFKAKLNDGSKIELVGSENRNERGISLDGASGIMTIDLLHPDLPNMIVTNNLVEIRLQGQTSTAEELIAENERVGVGLCYVETAGVTTRSLTKITCNGAVNKRRIIFGIKKVPAPGILVPGSPVEVNFVDSAMNPEWRLMFVAENTPLTFTGMPGSTAQLTIMGGIQTDGSVTAPAAPNGLKIIQDPLPRRLNRLAPRMGWIESYLDIASGEL